MIISPPLLAHCTVEPRSPYVKKRREIGGAGSTDRRGMASAGIFHRSAELPAPRDPELTWMDGKVENTPLDQRLWYTLTHKILAFLEIKGKNYPPDVKVLKNHKNSSTPFIVSPQFTEIYPQFSLIHLLYS